MTNPNLDWQVPIPHSTLNVSMEDGTDIVLRRHGNPEGPRLVLSHGNGLAIDLYYPFWSLLMDDFDIIVYDLRNHGWNQVTSLGNHTIPVLVSDHDLIIEEIERHYGKKPQAVVYHSISALVSLLSSTTGAICTARVLFDPPMCKPGFGYEEFDAGATQAAEMIRRRTSRFESMEEMSFALRFFPLFQRAVPGVLDLVPMTTLRGSANGKGFELRCPAEFEAQIMDYATIFAVSVDFEEQVCPTKVIGADPTLPYAYLPTFDFSDVVAVDYDFIPDATHLLQLEKPEECVAVMRQFLEPILGT